ncbi:hypothetical protein AB0I39_02995 [Kitasatospora purpeofusca]|uniref:hypothetical protein n=1 Tax=Kitasatospora purpeofusca TaxID=67352 RepID=UPI0033E773E1
MHDFDHSTLAFVDDIRDRERSLDGYSRYGEFLAHHADRFDRHDALFRSADFAVAVWECARSAFMGGGYVEIRPDLLDLRPVIALDHSLQMRARVGLRHHHLAHPPAGQTADWARDPWQHTDQPWQHPWNPYSTDDAWLLATAELTVPVPLDMLTQPIAGWPYRTLTDEAKHVVSALASHANTVLAPLVADLLGGAR